MIFKNLTQICQQFAIKPSENRIVHSISGLHGFTSLDKPTLSSELTCPVCNGNEYAIACENTADKNGRQSWICIKRDCGSLKGLKIKSGGYIQAPAFKGLKWAEFCEKMGIGDEFYDVSFEGIKQNAGKLQYLNEFVLKPSGFLLMRGETGRGKTYCALGICQRFIKSSNSCLFITFKEMYDTWMASFPEVGNYSSKFKVVTLLVIDDFGIDDPSEKFMTFIMDIFNIRNQWSDRATIITTNMNEQKFSSVCGEALMDRISTGVIFEFNEDKSRRPKRIL